MTRSVANSRLLILLFLISSEAFAAIPNDSTILKASDNSIAENEVRHFESLHLLDNENTDPIIALDLELSDTILNQRAHAHELLQKVLGAQRFLESLDALSEIELPVGVVKSGSDLDYSILIDRIEFTKEGAVMDVYVSLALPQTGARLAFHGKVPLSAQGGIAGNAKVYLLGDHSVKLNDNALVTLRGNERTYVEFDCSGFLGVNLDAELEFSTDFLVPENERGEAMQERFRLWFTTYTQSLHDMLVQVTLPPFQVKGLDGFGFHVTQAYLDWSDLANPPELSFPSSYRSPLLEAGLDNLWQGIYLKQLEIRLPKAFTRKATERISVGASGMIIDDLGVTGELHVENIFSDGDMNGWRYSLDKLGLELTANRVSGFSLEGKLSIPVIKSKDGSTTAFSYVAHRGAEGDYVFSVAVEDELKLDLWLADIKLMKGSRVIVAERENRFYPSAHLNGELTINFSGKGPKAQFNSVRFENMVINSEAPYFLPGVFGFGREGHSSSVAKYPVVFDNISLKADDTRVGLAFDFMLNISGKPDDESFAGKAGLIVWGRQENEPKRDAVGKPIALDRFTWQFEKVELTSVKINIKKPKVFELAGEVRFYDEDPIYGEGFKGTLNGSIHAIKVEAEALFGKTESFRYWYADALVELKTGIPIVPGVLSAFGFGGGYYSRMKQADKAVDGTLGRSPSGITYIPDENTVGIRAIVLIGTPRPEAMRGDVALEVSINRNGGINSVTFTGNANFMSTASVGSTQIKQLASAAVAGNLAEKLEGLSRGQVFGSVRLYFDNVNDIFHGNLEIYVNVAGGIVRGVSERNKAGWAVLHFERNDWYILIGTPDQPLGLEVARIFKAKSYFMLGKNLPGSPPPPEQVSEILGNVDLDYMRDMNALESGMGIAFGLHFLVDTGDLRFLMFYGRFSAGTGLDFMLKDYGNEYHCAGSSGQMGINGWYANGQAYAFVMGTIGIKVNLKFYKGKYEILSIGAAAILQAKGPNPFWMKGMVGGYYRILGGLIKGKCSFEVTVGKECKPVADENLLDDVNMIAGITPANSSRDVNVFNTPQIAFNIPVGEVFEITDMEGNSHQFRAVLDEFTVSDGGRHITGMLIWNAANDVVVFDASDLLPGKRRLKARGKLTFEEKLNGIWSKVKFQGKTVAETVESTFETEEAPGFIPESNIAWSYPIAGQANFYPKEFTQGFIQLRDGQPYLFTNNADWIQRVRMTEMESGQYLESALTYNPRERLVTFLIPEGFQNSRTYKFEILNVPLDRHNVDDNVQRIETDLNPDAAAGSAILTTQTVQGQLDLAETRAIFTSSFRTSSYNTFSEKMRNVTLAPAFRLSTGINIFQLVSQLRGVESFDEAEVPGPGASGLVRMEAILEDNTWYEDYAYPLVYADYPLLGWMKVRRDEPFRLGIPPVRDIHIDNVAIGQTGTEAVPFTSEMLVYNLGPTVASDYFDMQRHAVNYLIDHPGQLTPRLESLIIEPLPHLRYGRYRLRFQYVIPPFNKTTSYYDMEMFNRIRDND